MAVNKAGEGNRTLVCSLGSYRSTIELHPQRIFRLSIVDLRFASGDHRPVQLLRFAAEEFPERIKKFVRKVVRLFAERIQLLRELHLITAVNFTRGRRNLVRRNVELVRCAGGFATGRREMI